MKNAKLALTIIVIIGTIGGALAFKANRSFHVFYGYGTSTIAGQPVTGCVVSTRLLYTPAPDGITSIPYSSAVNISSITCLAQVNPYL